MKPPGPISRAVSGCLWYTFLAALAALVGVIGYSAALAVLGYLT